MKSKFNIRSLTPGDIELLVAQTDPENWAKDNEMQRYNSSALAEFFKNPTNHLFAAFDKSSIAGLALCYQCAHPDGEENALYVHELDTHPGYRRQGVATELMRYIFDYAAKNDLTEVWLGTETDNHAANEFYKSLQPSEVTSSLIYSYKTKAQQ